MAARRRLDVELVHRELAASREQARRWIDDRQVTVNGAIALKPASLVAPADAVEVLAPPPQFVGRGGDKLSGALEAFGIDPAGRRCLDVGSSTGGFTDCLLQRSAVGVVAVDVGTNQLHERLRADGRVDVRERTDIRSVEVADVDGPFDLVVVDVSFIGLGLIVDKLAELVTGAGSVIALVKPQFEAGKQHVDRGRGVIADPAVWRSVLDKVADECAHTGLIAVDAAVSPIKGGAGNVEFFLHLRPNAAGSTSMVTESGRDGGWVGLLQRAGELP